jgi:hypothetical protein
MVTESDLLQANATIIAGILIFLTIAPFSQSLSAQRRERKVMLVTVYITLLFLIASILLISFSYGTDTEDVFLGAKISFGIGLFGVAFVIATAMVNLPKGSESAASGHGKVPCH